MRIGRIRSSAALAPNQDSFLEKAVEAYFVPDSRGALVMGRHPGMNYVNSSLGLKRACL